MTAETTEQQTSFGLGDESSIWFNLSPLLKDPDNPMPFENRESSFCTRCEMLSSRS